MNIKSAPRIQIHSVDETDEVFHADGFQPNQRSHDQLSVNGKSVKRKSTMPILNSSNFC